MRILSIRFLFFVLLSGSFRGFAQLPNAVFFKETSDSLLPRFALHLDHLNFLKNNEYFSKMADGRTLFGQHILPQMVFRPAANFSLSGGALFWMDYGNAGFHKILPVFTAQYQQGRHTLRMGTLDGALAHQLIEPLFDFERQFLNRLENGFQWKYRTRRCDADVWIDWQNMIYPNDPDQERILAGYRWDLTLLEKSRSKIDVLLQGSVFHRGGQIDTNNSPVLTTFNPAFGFRWRQQINPDGFLKSLDFQGFAVAYQNLNPGQVWSGGFRANPYLNLNFDTKWFQLMLSYWQSKNFDAQQGGVLYRNFSASVRHRGWQEQERQLLFVRLMKDWALAPNIYITARFEPYFDLRNNLFEFSHGLYFTYRGNLWTSTPHFQQP